jgi:hypothetical protein
MSTEQPQALRIGDAERESAAAELGEHYAQGRLSADEHAERLDQVWASRTRAELAPLFRDLPGGTYGARPAVPQQRRRDPSWRSRRLLPVPLFLAVPLLVLVAVAVHLPFLLFGLFALLVLTRGGRRHHRHAAWAHRRC